MPFRVVMRHLDGRGVLEEWRVPLVRLSALEPKPIVEALARGPTVERTTGAKLVIRRVMPFAKGGGAVLIGLKNLRNTCRFPGPLTVIAGKAGCQLRNATSVDRVVVASGEERRSRRRAKRRGMKAVEAQTFVCEALERRGLNRAAKCARLSESNVIKQNRE